MLKNRKKRYKKTQIQGSLTFRIITLRFYSILMSIFLIISVFSLPAFKNQVFHVESIERITNSETITNTLLAAMGTEIPQLNHAFDTNIPPLSSLALSLSTGINTRDFTSYLERELPGFQEYNTKIYVAGIGSDYSNLPVESPPPDFDELLEDEDMSTDQNEEPPTTDPESNNPSVFVYHSHSWEAFRPLMDEEVKPSDSSSINQTENIVLVGTMMEKELEKYGIDTLHNKANVAKELKSRGLEWTDSYTLSREFIDRAVSKNQSLSYYIDIHRDAAGKDITTMNIHGKSYARLYFVVGEANKNYKENLKFVERLNAELEKRYPGISRGIYPKDKTEGNGIYNQDLSNRAILIEVGGIDNTKEELKNTVEAFAEVFQKFYHGAIEVNAQ